MNYTRRAIGHGMIEQPGAVDLKRLGDLLRALIRRWGLTHEGVVEALPVGFKIDERTLRRYLTGENRISRDLLIMLLVKVLHQELATVNSALNQVNYEGLSGEEVDRYKAVPSVRKEINPLPIMPAPEPQETLWGLNVGKPPGICISNSLTGEFIPWAELKPEIEKRLLNQLGLHIPANCTLALDDFHGRDNWLVRIIDPEGRRLGYVWFGTNADDNWAYDGLVRAGDDTYVVWQVLQRYSDGSYRRIRTQAPRTKA